MASNGGRIGGHEGVSASMHQEMAAYDQLGPNLRKAYQDCVFNSWSCVAAVNQFHRRGMDPHNPIHDQKLAQELRAIDVRKAAQIKEGAT